MKCKCGFKFSEPGEYRNCEAFITDTGRSGVICPKCGKQYIDGEEVKLKINEDIGVNTPAGIIEPFTDNSIPICYRCGCKITKENKSMWSDVVEGNKTQHICIHCEIKEEREINA